MIWANRLLQTSVPHVEQLANAVIQVRDSTGAIPVLAYCVHFPNCALHGTNRRMHLVSLFPTKSASERVRDSGPKTVE